jgi:AraC family transcriptional regulator
LRTPSDQPNDAELDYVKRVNRAIDFVLANLDQPLQLEHVAQVAHFSPFHFHRVFRAMLGETLHQFAKRLRLERALTLLSHDPDRSLTQVAIACGFQSSSDFSRSFKQRYGVPPSAFDVAVFRAQRREEWQAATADVADRHLLRGLPAGDNPDGFEVEFVQLPPRTVAYLRVLDPFRPDVVPAAAQRLMAWAEQRGVAAGQWLGYMWDDPDIVAHAQCRYDVGIVVEQVQAEGEVGRIEFPAMLMAQIAVRGGIDLEMRALDWLYKTWLPSSGYLPTDQPCFEAWLGYPFAHGMEHFELFVQLPVGRG